MRHARIMAGIPAVNPALYHKIRFSVCDPVVWLSVHDPSGNPKAILLLRDIEMERARSQARADEIYCPADFTPVKGLSGDRETAMAQAAAECLVRKGIPGVTADRTLPLIYAHYLEQAGIELICDPDMGLIERRAKDEQEIEWLQEAQSKTEQAVRLACETIAKADANADGVLIKDGSPLTSERVRAIVDQWLLGHGYHNPTCIVASGPCGADCHDVGTGLIRTGHPTIVDIFPTNRQTRYVGDCTRTVVHGDIPDPLLRIHEAVVEAKAAAIKSIKAGITGEQVHAATSKAIIGHGFSMGLPGPDAPHGYCGMVHGTGHGVGLEVHEPPLLDKGGPALVEGDVVTVEPGLYCKALGGVRVEDMVVVTASGSVNLNALSEGMNWDG